jgi:hypothetical protein
MKSGNQSRWEESELEKSPNNGLECNRHPRHGSCVRTSRAGDAGPLSPDVGEKSGWQKFNDYHLRILGTPVTLAVDAVTTVAVVGVIMFLNDPDGTCSLIEALCN